MEYASSTMSITEVTTFVGTQITALGDGIMDLLVLLVPLALGVFLFYWGFRKLKGAIS